MNQKFIFCIAFLVIFCCDILISSAAVENNLGDFDDINKTLTIYDNESKVMTVKLISAVPDIGTFTEIFEVSNFDAYTSDSKLDFIARTDTKVGIGDVIGIEWFSEQNVSYVMNVTDYDINQVEEEVYNNKTGKNETILANKTVITGYHDETRYKVLWVDYQPYDKEMKAGSVQRIKVIYHKIPELGPFQIQTVPVFRGVECPELTWWSGSWDRRRTILINNTAGDSVVNYQLKSVNLSLYNINASSARIINSISDIQESFWNETVDVNGNLEYVWCNFSSLPSGSWINSTYYIYYQSLSSVDSVSDGDETFILFNGGTFTGWNNNGVTISGNELTLAVSATSYLASQTLVDRPAIIEYTKRFTLDQSGHILSGLSGQNTRGTNNELIQFVINEYDNSYTSYRTGGVASYTQYTTLDGNDHDYKIEWIDASTTNFYIDDVQKTSPGSNYPTGSQLYLYFGGEYRDSFAIVLSNIRVREYTTNEPEPWTVGEEEEYVAPTPTPTPAPTTSVSPTQYDELDLPLILYIVMISMLYLLIVFRHGVAAVELSLIYLIFAFFFLLFQTITISVNYIYLTLFLLLFLISIAGITKQGVD